jgi:protein tyrosine/serine phosphatase
LLRGAQPKEAGFASLAEMGVVTVIDLRAGHDEREACEARGLRCVHIPMHAWNAEEEDVVRFLSVVAHEENRPVFVHCRRGADRTGMVVAVYRVVVQGWSKQDALREMTEGPYDYNPLWKNLTRYVRNMDVDALREAAGLTPAHATER